MNRIILTEEDFCGSCCVRLKGRRFVHLQEVIKAGPGKEVKVGLLNGPCGTGVVSGVASDYIDLNVSLTEAALPPTELRVLMALPRPKTFRKALHAAVTMGVTELWFFETYKVEKSYWSSPMLEESFLREELLLALEQSGDTRLPRVEFRRRFKIFVEDEFPSIVAGSRVFAAHPGSCVPCPANVSGPVSLCLGPEGGFTEYEVEKLCAAGAQLIGLGERILRTEVALPALLGRLLPLR